MKLQQIQIQKSTSTRTVQNIKRTLQGVKTIGYILMETKTKVQTVKGKIKIYKSKAGRKIAMLAMKTKQVCSRLFNQCFAQAGIFEARITQAKKALKDAKKMMLTTLEWFNLHVAMCKAVLHLRSFKYSLPKYITNLLF